MKTPISFLKWNVPSVLVSIETEFATIDYINKLYESTESIELKTKDIILDKEEIKFVENIQDGDFDIHLPWINKIVMKDGMVFYVTWMWKEIEKIMTN